MENDAPLTITLTVEQVNRIMSLLGEHPHKQVHDIIMALKIQGDIQLEEHRKKQETSPPGDKSKKKS